jgi:hypothetical protein
MDPAVTVIICIAVSFLAVSLVRRMVRKDPRIMG